MKRLAIMNRNTIIMGQKGRAAHRLNPGSSSCCTEGSEGSGGAFLPTSRRFFGFAPVHLEAA